MGLADRLDDDGNLPGMSSAATTMAIGLAGSLSAGDVPLLLERLAAAESDLARIREHGTDERLLRWCRWPGCLRSYAADPGPAERGWTRSPAGMLLCPAHSKAEHGLTIVIVKPSNGSPALPDVTGLCECGETAELGKSVSTFDVFDWWSIHLTDRQDTDHDSSR